MKKLIQAASKLHYTRYLSTIVIYKSYPLELGIAFNFFFRFIHKSSHWQFRSLQFQIKLVTKRAPENYEAMEEGREAHWEVVQRILFLYAKLNPGQGYVQGMNEIIGPIYYILASDPDVESRRKFFRTFSFISISIEFIALTDFGVD